MHSFLASVISADVLGVCYIRKASNKGTICQEMLYRNDKYVHRKHESCCFEILIFLYKLLIRSTASRMNFSYIHTVLYLQKILQLKINKKLSKCRSAVAVLMYRSPLD